MGTRNLSRHGRAKANGGYIGYGAVLTGISPPGQWWIGKICGHRDWGHGGTAASPPEMERNENGQRESPNHHEWQQAHLTARH
jgi:hypothetical protein